MIKINKLDDFYIALKSDNEYYKILKEVKGQISLSSLESFLRMNYKINSDKRIKNYLNNKIFELKKTNLKIYKLLYIKQSDLYLKTLENLLKTGNELEKLLILDKLIMYKISSDLNYKYISEFCNLYESYEDKAEIPAYIHLKYYEVYMYMIFNNLKNEKNHIFTTKDFSIFIIKYNNLKLEIKKYVNEEILENKFLEIQINYACLLEMEISIDDMQLIIYYLNTYAQEKLKNKINYSIGIIWSLEKSLEYYFAARKYRDFVFSLDLLISYSNIYLKDINLLNNKLNSSGNNNLSSFALSLKRTCFLNDMFKNKIKSSLINLKDEDKNFINSENFVNRIIFDDTISKENFIKSNNYIETWISKSKPKLQLLCDRMVDFKR